WSSWLSRPSSARNPALTIKGSVDRLSRIFFLAQTVDPASLTLLVEIIEAGNLSKAARKLKMTRANVSYHLNQLERSVGLQLVRRTTRRVEPTEVGLRLYQHGPKIQKELPGRK